MPTITHSPNIPQIIAMAADPQKYSLIRIMPTLGLMYAYCNKEMAYHHFKSLQSHGYRVVVVWNGLIVRSC